MTEPHAYALHYGRSTKPLAWLVPDERWPKMWCIRWPDGSTSDMVNLSRAKDAAVVIWLRSSASHDARMFHWKLAPRREAIQATPHALNRAAGVLQPPDATEPARIDVEAQRLIAEEMK